MMHVLDFISILWNCAVFTEICVIKHLSWYYDLLFYLHGTFARKWNNKIFIKLVETICYYMIHVLIFNNLGLAVSIK